MSDSDVALWFSDDSSIEEEQETSNSNNTNNNNGRGLQNDDVSTTSEESMEQPEEQHQTRTSAIVNPYNYKKTHQPVQSQQQQGQQSIRQFFQPRQRVQTTSNRPDGGRNTTSTQQRSSGIQTTIDSSVPKNSRTTIHCFKLM